MGKKWKPVKRKEQVAKDKEKSVIRVAAEIFLNKEFYEAAEVPYRKDSTLLSLCCHFSLLWKLQPTEQSSSNWKCL